MSGNYSSGKERCYWCGGEPADGGTIKIQLNEGEPKRQTCPDCFREWPPEHPDIETTDTQ